MTTSPGPSSLPAGPSPLPAGYRLVDPRDRRGEFLEVDRLAFAMATDPEVDAVVPVTLDWERTVGVEAADGRLAGVHASYPFSLPVPGGAVATAGLTWVGVRPDHRRRGLLGAMIATHFERSAARGEPVSALFAAESGIYGRFGYGCAADDLRVTLTRGTALRDVPGSEALDLRLETLDVEEHLETVERVHAAAGRGRPGWILRDTDVLRRRHLVDPPAWRFGGEPLRIVTVRGTGADGGGSDGAGDGAGDGGGVRGYALLRRTERWEDGRPRGKVELRELVALDAAAAHRLWSFVLDLDLTSTVEGPPLPVDDALPQLLADPREAVARLRDNLWVRLLDLPAALTARRYAAPLDVVLGVTDDRLPQNAGTWRLRTTPTDDPGEHAATVERSTDPADVTLDVRELGAAYLGGRALGALAAAGLVTEHRRGALATTSTAFGWPVAPVCTWGW
ncbi:GNAT family N-acetyltransferase [Cellulomonas sp. ATA003]|uniref:GNAT family N-acetyltransferase n=1 Tax=Cellulomonas sp. ATA003 TaxID=3073064 RepID=UPI002873B869|nr:GNAT family N-acetyltransferase [Cellulomonas sp. ATA003]WNB86749.1 GNAT family N-acetyltransferase [Cellulomonas sp. ATA003]